MVWSWVGRDGRIVLLLSSLIACGQSRQIADAPAAGDTGGEGTAFAGDAGRAGEGEGGSPSAAAGAGGAGVAVCDTGVAKLSVEDAEAAVRAQAGGDSSLSLTELEIESAW